jgi:hypothetical protein
MRNAIPAQLDTAVTRGLEFIYSTACVPENFETYGYDYLSCFHCIASTSKDVNLRRMARQMGQDRARHWRRANPRIPNDADADYIAYLVFGTAAADKLGVRDVKFKQQIRRTARQHSAGEFFSFDPRIEPPPCDVPAQCECGLYNPRGRKTCNDCHRRLSKMSCYEVWVDALTRSYAAERYGVRLDASLADVLKWLPMMRPYPAWEDGDEDQYYWAIYAVTHVVYVLNDYSRYQLSRAWLPREYAFLKRNLRRALEMDDPETTGELLDSLKSFGLSNDDPLIRNGMAYLLSCQNADGSWGDADADDMYRRYHPTWTAIDGLRDYAWRGKRLSFPGLRPLLTRNDKSNWETRPASRLTQFL